MMGSRTSPPPPPDAPSSPAVSAPSSSTTSTAASTPETGIATRTSPMSLTPSSRSTMASLLTPSTSDMDVDKIKGNVNAEVPVHSTRVRVGRSIDGFGLSPGITKEQRLGVENLLKSALSKLTGDLAGTYYPLTGMDEKVRQQLVDDHFLFVSGDRNLIAAGMERDWPEGRGIFHN